MLLRVLRMKKGKSLLNKSVSKEEVFDFLDSLVKQFADEYKTINFKKECRLFISPKYVKGVYRRSHFKSLYSCGVFFGVDPKKLYVKYNNYLKS